LSIFNGLPSAAPRLWLFVTGCDGKIGLEIPGHSGFLKCFCFH